MLLAGCVEGPLSVDDDDATPIDLDDDDSAGCEEPGPAGDDLVYTTVGPLQGVAVPGGWGFLGVPFAQAPTDERRWTAPEPPVCDPQVRPAQTLGPRCPQLADGVLTGDEDCLQLNVWTPELGAPDEPRPVLFFVHGGGHIQGSTRETIAGSDALLYDGGRVVRAADVVVVTANYRLGALGYLAHPALGDEDGGRSGNYGLLDLLEALRWVRANIAAFGGDPDRVLLFGESAGATNVCALMTSPAAEGLFSAALMESGGCGGATLALEEQAGVVWAEELGCADAADVANCLRQVPADDLAALSSDVASNGIMGGGGFGPVVDGVVLPELPQRALEGGRQHDVPLVVGANEDETATLLGPMSEAAYNAAVATIFQTRASEVLAQYPPEDFASPRWAWIALTSDAQFLCPARRIARAADASQSAPVHRYFFTLAPSGAAGPELGAFHGLELLYVFQGLDAVAEATGYSITDEDRAVQLETLRHWTRLAAGRDLVDPSQAVPWPTLGGLEDRHLEFGPEIRAGAGVRSDYCDFWDDLFGP